MGVIFLGVKIFSLEFGLVIGVGVAVANYSAVDLWDFPVCIHGVGDGIRQDTPACYDFLFAFAFLRAGKPLLR